MKFLDSLFTLRGPSYFTLLTQQRAVSNITKKLQLI